MQLGPRLCRLPQKHAARPSCLDEGTHGCCLITAMQILIPILLVFHIAAGFIALITGFIASTTTKGGTRHRQSGRIYFWSMTGVFITATVIGLLREKWFLFMVGFF